jgi:hypothetical protein
MAYDQEFFLALAAKGKDAWNAWWRDPANTDVHVTFAGIDFSEAPKDQIDFSGFEFGDHANFSKCKWRGAEWQECEDNRETFTVGRACFTGATFGHGARFNSSAFGNGADFSGVKFVHGASFPNAVFGHGAFFKGAAFGHRASFDSAAFGNRANFNGAAFGEEASFNGATFGERASFEGAAFANPNFTAATFGDEASFTGAAFGDRAKFTSGTFGERANFATAAFGNLASFIGAAFGDQANFAGAAFGELARFDETVFKGRVEITAIPFDKWQAFKALLAAGHPHRDTWSLHGPGPNTLVSISFARARFDGGANFSGRSFNDAADFTNARFYSPPDFDAAASAARIDFSGVHIGFVPPGRLRHWTTESKVPLRLRRLRKIAEDTKNHDLERDLYIEERKAERGVYLHQLLGLDELKKNLEDINEQKKHVWLEWRLRRRARNAHWLGILAKPDKIARLFAHILWIAVMGVYWAVSDYGRSFVRPAVWLVSSGFFFYWSYSEVLAKLMAKAPDIEKYKQAVRMLALGNTVPFVGPLTIDSKVMFCPCRNCSDTLVPPEGYQWLVLGQNILSIILVFFIGLALRNYFRIK